MAGVWNFLKDHAMDCIVWANNMALTPVDELPRPVAGTVSELASRMMKEEDADLLESVDGPHHPNIEKTREKYFAKKKAEEEQQLSEKAGNYYNDDWIIAKDKELRELQRKEVATDSESKRVLVYIIEVAVEALKSRFQ